VLGQTVGVGRLRIVLFAERTALHPVFEAGPGDQHLLHARLYRTFDEPVVGHQVVLEMEQRAIVRQPRPGQVCECIDAFGQRADVQIRCVNIRADELDVIDPRHVRRFLHVTRNRPHRAATAQQCRDQMATDEAGGSGNQNLHSTLNSGTAITKRPSHWRTWASC